MANEDEPQEIPFLDEESHEIDRKWLLERAIPDVVKRVVERAVETGVEKITEGPENLRNLVGDMKVPKEVIQYLYGQVDETKKKRTKKE